MNEEVKLSPPWEVYVKELTALFRGDPCVKVVYDKEGEDCIHLYVEGDCKAEAISKILPEEVTFGDHKIQIVVVPSNNTEDPVNLFKTAFNANPNVKEIFTLDGPTRTFVSFRKEVVQYYRDDLGNPYGIRSTLYEDIARRVLKSDVGVFFCTDVD